MLQKYFFLLLILLTSCQHKPEKISNSSDTYFKYAKHIQVDRFDTYDIVTVSNAYPNAPDYQYLLKHKNTIIPDSLAHLPVINVPIKNIVVTSTTHLPALSMLGVADKLLAFPNLSYISDSIFRQKIDTGKIEDIGNGRQLNTEKLLQLHPEVLMRFSSGQEENNDAFLQEKGISVIYNADWREQNPLGRAEWLKLFGLLFHKEDMADSLFSEIEAKYKAIQKQIDSQSYRPKVFQGGMFGDKWFVPGGKSYAVQLIKDAGGHYLWNDDEHEGSVVLNYENVIQKLPKADAWLNPGMVNSKNALLQQLPFIKDLKVFQQDQIYTYNLTKGPTGGVIYFEDSYAHPERALSDLFKIFHPEKAKEVPFYYYKKLPKN
jgi:iron complex transport system substrate-binding protein